MYREMEWTEKLTVVPYFKVLILIHLDGMKKVTDLRHSEQLCLNLGSNSALL